MRTDWAGMVHACRRSASPTADRRRERRDAQQRRLPRRPGQVGPGRSAVAEMAEPPLRLILGSEAYAYETAGPRRGPSPMPMRGTTSPSPPPRRRHARAADPLAPSKVVTYCATTNPETARRAMRASADASDSGRKPAPEANAERRARLPAGACAAERLLGQPLVLPLAEGEPTVGEDPRLAAVAPPSAGRGRVQASTTAAGHSFPSRSPRRSARTSRCAASCASRCPPA